MKTVKVFYAGIPSKNNNAEKVDVLRFFHMGVTVNIQTGKGCRTLEQSMKTDTFQQEVPLSLPTCVTMWSI